MDWTDIAAAVFFATAVNHLGLIRAIEDRTGLELPVANCPKCASFWSVLTYGVVSAGPLLFTLHHSLRLLAISALCSYLAVWLELLMYAIDTLYNRIYGILKDNNDEEEERTEG